MRPEISISQRQSHLANMGVAQWYARAVLLGAKSSPEELFQETDCDERGGECNDINPAPQELLTALKGRASAIQSADSVAEHGWLAKQGVASSNELNIAPMANAGVPAGLDAVAKPSDLVSSEAHTEVEGDALSPVSVFSVNCYASSDFIIITECANQSGVRRELQLLSNIFMSVDLLRSACSELEYIQSFNWPVFHSLNLQSGQGLDLNQAINLWLNEVSSNQKNVFYFGGGHLALQARVDECLSKMKLHSFKYSLQDLLQIPTRKKEIWMQLKLFSLM